MVIFLSFYCLNHRVVNINSITISKRIVFYQSPLIFLVDHILSSHSKLAPAIINFKRMNFSIAGASVNRHTPLTKFSIYLTLSKEKLKNFFLFIIFVKAKSPNRITNTKPNFI